MMVMREEVFYDIFLDLNKSYGALDYGLCLDTLAAYGVVPQDIRLLRRYLDRLTMVTRYGSYLGPPFKGQIAVNQGP